MHEDNNGVKGGEENKLDRKEKEQKGRVFHALKMTILHTQLNILTFPNVPDGTRPPSSPANSGKHVQTFLTGGCR